MCVREERQEEEEGERGDGEREGRGVGGKGGGRKGREEGREGERRRGEKEGRQEKRERESRKVHSSLLWVLPCNLLCLGMGLVATAGTHRLPSAAPEKR